MKVVTSTRFHPEYTDDPAAAPGRIEAVREAIRDIAEFVEARPATPAEIGAVHSQSHLDSVVAEGVYDIAALAAGGAIQTAEIGLAEPCFGLIRPPGHHASARSAWGFCYFNNMAVALRALYQAKRISSAFVLDIDLHYGDGNVSIMRPWSWVTVYNPESGERGSTLDEVEEQLARCRADVIGISAGFDNHVEDWGRTLETEDYHVIGRAVRRAADRAGGGSFALFEGGYNHSTIGLAARALMQGMMDARSPDDD